MMLHHAALTLTITASGPLDAGDLVAFSGGRVSETDQPVKGIALHPAAPGDPVALVVIGAATCRARGVIAPGQVLVSSAAGGVMAAPHGCLNPVGRALNSAADGGWAMIILAGITGGSLAAMPEMDQAVQRPALALSAPVMHSGHSLTDAYSRIQRIHYARAARPWEDHTFATIAGSATRWRWENYSTASPNPRDNMDDFDALVITERGLDQIGVAPITHATFLEDIFYELRFADRAIASGAEVILWSIWPSYAWPNWRTILADCHARFKVRAEYLTWKLQQLYPSWHGRIWIAPGHLLIERLSGELPPGIPSFESLFTDDIHPGEILNHGLAILVEAMLYKSDPAGWPGTDRPASMTPDQEDWFRSAAWSILQGYEPAGFGGSTGAAKIWDGHDWYPSITTPAQLAAASFESGVAHPGVAPTGAGSWPADVTPALRWTAAETAGLSMTGTTPEASGGVLMLPTGSADMEGSVSAGFESCEIIAALRTTTTANVNEPLVALTATGGGMWWNAPHQGLFYNGWVKGWQAKTSSGGVVAEAYLSNTAEAWTVVSARFAAHAPTIEANNVEALDVFTGAAFSPAFLRIGNPSLPDIEIAALAVIRGPLTDAQREEIQGWAAGNIPRG